jgi:hypothetical protein
MNFDSDDDDDDFVAALVMSSGLHLALFAHDRDSSDNYDDVVINHRTLPQAAHQKFNHDRARYCIQKDYLGVNCLFFEIQFRIHFMVSRGRYEVIAQKLAANDPHFYSERRSANKEPVASTQAKLLIALKSISYGVLPRAFTDYFQMSDPLAHKCREKLVVNDAMEMCMKACSKVSCPNGLSLASISLSWIRKEKSRN